MPKPKRQRIAPTERWEQLELLFTSPEQRIYELIRPVVLFGVPPKERAQETGAAAARRAELAAADRAVDEVSALIRSLTRAVLLTNGFHQHQRQWRRHRGFGK